MAARRTFLQTMGILGSLLMGYETQANTGKEGPLKPLLTSGNKENSYWYIGHLMSLLLISGQTGGRYALLHATERRGLEPPPHTHTKEDETFLILKGAVIYTAGDQTFSAKAGDVMFLPRNIQHSFKIQTETLETLMLLTPGGFENYFIEMGVPAGEFRLPPVPEGPPDIPKLIATASKYGISFAKP